MSNNSLTPELIYNFLKNYQLMAIATYGATPWIANVYYAVTPELKLYFLSNPSTTHCQQISKNPEVACSMYDSTQTPQRQKEFSKIGIQLSGTARLLTEDKEVEAAIELWKKTLGVLSDEYSLEGMKQQKIDGRIYEVSPHKIKMFHEDLFEEGNVPVLTL